MCLEPDGIHVILADTNQNIYEGELTKNYMVEFAGGEYDCDVTRLYPGSTINAEGVLVDDPEMRSRRMREGKSESSG